MLLEWSSRYDHLREVTREDIIAARDAVTGKQRESRIVALRSLFRHGKKNGQIFRNPTIRVLVPRQTGGVLQVLVQADIDEAIATATTPDIGLIIALAAVHAARPEMIRTMQLDDVDLGNRRITVGSHVRPRDELTRRAVLAWLDHRRSLRSNTANPHLLITQKTTVERPDRQALDHPGHPQPHRHPRTAPRRPPARRGPHPRCRPAPPRPRFRHRREDRHPLRGLSTAASPDRPDRPRNRSSVTV
ncbi:hypothetical protein [Streptomyces sp. NBC_00239]|uniref:hypothetical protein n=1 Tax=Streptomyces sp. NBC_00239 TaxID=2903640 RepID=UPI002E294D66|nr:hypothetical protein [Streptomyces sp. NBC_00239]